MRQIVFWMYTPCLSIDYFLEKVAEEYDGRVVVMFAKAEVETRRILSSVTQGPTGMLTDLIGEKRFSDVVRQFSVSPDAVHIFATTYACPKLRAAFSEAARSGATIGIFSEAPTNSFSWWDVRYFLKRAYIQWYLPLITRANIPSVRLFVCLSGGGTEDLLAVRRWLARDLMIVPFGYYPKLINREAHINANSGSAEPSFLSVGMLQSNKRVDWILRAASILSKEKLNFRVRILGEGPERNKLQMMARNLGVSEIVNFLGPVARKQYELELVNANALLAVGYREPWGMRINDAIGVGLPVICSDGLGASTIVRDSAGGLVFERSKFSAFVAAMRTVLEEPKVMEQMRHNALNARPLVDPSIAAQRFLNALDEAVNLNG